MLCGLRWLTLRLSLRCVCAAALLGSVLLLERSVLLKDARLTARVLRDLPRLRRSFHAAPPSAAPPPSTAAADASAASQSPALSSLAAFFSVLQELAAPSSAYAALAPRSAHLAASQLLAKDDGAAAAWRMAEQRLAEAKGEERKKEKEAAQLQKTDGHSMDVDDSKEGSAPQSSDSQALQPQPPATERGQRGHSGTPTAAPCTVAVLPVPHLRSLRSDAAFCCSLSVCTAVCMEVGLWLDVLYGVYLLDGDYYEDCASLFASLVTALQALNRRSADLLSAKVFYYYALAVERWEDANGAGGDGAQPPLLSSILPTLLQCYRSACLQHNEPGQAVLINAILRIHLLHHDYALADTFRLKSSYPSDLRLISSAVYARYCYYVGKILCIHLAYSDAALSLQQARRKAPQHRAQARHFKYHINLLAILTQLLMGEIPERTTFNEGASQSQQLATITALTRANSLGATKQSALMSSASSSPTHAQQQLQPPASSAAAGASSSSLSLYPYLCLTRAVRVGDLATFHAVTSRYAALFARDDVSSLILRLRHNVIKAGLRKINLSYSAIPMAAISTKLALEEDFSKGYAQPPLSSPGRTHHTFASSSPTHQRLLRLRALLLCFAASTVRCGSRPLLPPAIEGVHSRALSSPRAPSVDASMADVLCALSLFAAQSLAQRTCSPRTDALWMAWWEWEGWGAAAVSDRL